MGSLCLENNRGIFCVFFVTVESYSISMMENLLSVGSLPRRTRSFWRMVITVLRPLRPLRHS